MLNDEQRKFVEENYNMVYSCMFKMGFTEDQVEEYHGAAAIGLCRAAMTYDPAKSKFSTYAYRCIRNAIFVEMRRGVSIDKKQKTLRLDDKAISSNDKYTLQETLPAIDQDLIRVEEDRFKDSSIYKAYNKVIQKYDPKRQDMINLHIAGMTFEQIAKRYGVSRQRVGQVWIKFRKKIEEEMSKLA